MVCQYFEYESYIEIIKKYRQRVFGDFDCMWMLHVLVQQSATEGAVLRGKPTATTCAHSLSAGGRGSLTQGKTLSAVIHSVQEEEVLSLKVRHSVQEEEVLSLKVRHSVQSFTQCKRKRFSHSR